MKKMNFLCMSLFACLLLFASCTKHEYVEDDNGDNSSTPNNAYSDLVQVAPNNWQISSDGNTFITAYDASSVPNGFVFNTDGVLVYVSGTNDENSIYSPLPLTTATVNDFYVDYYLTKNTVVLELIPADGSKATSANLPSSDFYFNLVFLQPSDLTSSSVNFKDYNAVKAAYHL